MRYRKIQGIYISLSKFSNCSVTVHDAFFTTQIGWAFVRHTVQVKTGVLQHHNILYVSFG